MRSVARAALPVGFGGVEAPESWPRPRSAPRADRLEASVESLDGVGPTIARRLGKLGLRTVGDLLWQRPRRYEEPVPTKRICDLFGDEEAVIEGVVRSATSRRRGRLKILTARIADETGEIKATWFNQPWLEAKLVSGTAVRIRGRANRHGFAVSSYDLEGDAETGDFAPVYPAGEDVTQKKLRDLHARALEHVRDVGDDVHAVLLAAERMPLRADALSAIHRPRSLPEAEVGRARLAFEELLVLRLALLRTAAAREAASAQPLGEPGELLERYRSSLPFTLTADQVRATAEIDADLDRAIPMQRLLQGDVGSGKTVVALHALLRAVERDRQGALMAPTETLAEQHFLTIDELCTPLGVRVTLLTSSLRAKEHAAARQLIASGDAQIVVGTHALIEKEVDFRDLAVAVVDEQHRFGVAQRTALVEGRSPHVLHLTATPIPRTLALTVYGDLEVSELALPPAERKPIITAWVNGRPQLRGLLAALSPPGRGAAGLRRLPAHRGVRDASRACGRGGGRAAPLRRAARLSRRLPARPPAARRAATGDGGVQGARARRPRGDDGDRGRRRRPERDDHDRPGGRSLRPRAASSAPRPGGTRRRAVLLPARLSFA